MAAGANQVNGVAFSLADPQAGEDQARRAAVKALQAKAALYAEASGYRLDRLISLSDSSPMNPIRPLGLPMARMQAVSTPVEPGELDVSATVTATYELKK